MQPMTFTTSKKCTRSTKICSYFLFIYFSPVIHLSSSVSSSFISMATVTIGELGGVIEQLSCCMVLQWKNIDHPEKLCGKITEQSCNHGVFIFCMG